MVSELDEIRRRVRNIWGAISSNQVIDKDVEGQAKELLDYIDELRRPSPSQRPAVDVVTEEMVEGAAKYMARDHAVSGNRTLDAVVDHVQNHWRRYAAEARAILSAALASLAPQGGEEIRENPVIQRNVVQDQSVATPANPAQVTDLIEDLEQAVVDFENARPDTYNRAKKELQRARAALTAAIGAGGQAVAEDWRDDPSADERWNAGLDYGQTQLCNVLGVDPETIDWDAATETLDGDVQAVIGKILTARFGDYWPSALSQPHPADERVSKAASGSQEEFEQILSESEGAIDRMANGLACYPSDERVVEDERVRRGMEEILKKQSERDIPFAPMSAKEGR